MNLLFLTTLCLSILTGIELEIFSPSLPEIKKIYNLSAFMVQFTLSANFISYCIVSLLIGVLGDKYDRKKIILLSLLIFILGSTLGAIANNFLWIVAARILQGIGIAGPSVLAFVILSREWTIDKQPKILSLLNGFVTITIMFSSTIGSYINLYFGWRGNFLMLLVFGILSLILCIISIPTRNIHMNHYNQLSYIPILKSQKAIIFLTTVTFIVTPYWTFVGLAPILYMDSMNVSLQEYGLYQGSIAGIFVCVSLLMPKILSILGSKKSLFYSIIIYGTGLSFMIMLSLRSIQEPLPTTLLMMIYVAGGVIPLSILYPISLKILENSESKASALINSMRLFFSAAAIEALSAYTENFIFIGFALSTIILICIFFLQFLIKKNWIPFSELDANKNLTQAPITYESHSLAPNSKLNN